MKFFPAHVKSPLLLEGLTLPPPIPPVAQDNTDGISSHLDGLHDEDGAEGLDAGGAASSASGAVPKPPTPPPAPMSPALAGPR